MSIKKTKSQIGKYSKSKGKRGEREIAGLLREYGYNARRGQQFKGTPDSPDVICKALPFNIEVKYTEKPNFKSYMKQSIDDSKKGQIPIVVHKYIRGEWNVMIRFDDFMPLMNKIYEKDDIIKDGKGEVIGGENEQESNDINDYIISLNSDNVVNVDDETSDLLI